MKFWFGILMGLLLGAAVTIGGYFLLKDSKLGDDVIVVTFTEEEIQSRLGEKFPRSERLLDLIPVGIAEPGVRFLGDSNRVELTMEADVAVPLLRTYKARGVFTTSLRYDPEDHTLRISDVTVESFQASDLPKRFEEPLRITMTAAARKYLNDHPVHTLKPKDYKGEMVKMFLRDLTVKEGKLEVTLGL